MNNAYRHGGGKGQKVDVSFDGSTINVQVSDEGEGFNEALQEPMSDRLGIFGMRKRVELFGGRFQIESRPDNGTRVWGYFPIQQRVTEHA